jgi:hypothetical protein
LVGGLSASKASLAAVSGLLAGFTALVLVNVNGLQPCKRPMSRVQSLSANTPCLSFSRANQV